MIGRRGERELGGWDEGTWGVWDGRVWGSLGEG